jgi:hypothetical protein
VEDPLLPARLLVEEARVGPAGVAYGDGHGGGPVRVGRPPEVDVVVPGDGDRRGPAEGVRARPAAILRVRAVGGRSRGDAPLAAFPRSRRTCGTVQSSG